MGIIAHLYVVREKNDGKLLDVSKKKKPCPKIKKSKKH